MSFYSSKCIHCHHYSHGKCSNWACDLNEKRKNILYSMIKETFLDKIDHYLLSGLFRREKNESKNKDR